VKYAFLILIGASMLLARGSAEDTPASGAAAIAGPVVSMEFSNPALSPAHWKLMLRPDGSGHFVSEMGKPTPSDPVGEMRLPDVNRDIQLSPKFAGSVFETAQRHAWFNQPCASHLKVAFQGWKSLSYSGPQGKGSCTFNYSKDKEIQALGDSFQAVAQTIMEGVRLEMLLQHDPLGLDKEIESLSLAAKDGRAQQICAIRGILERLAQDDGIMDLVRKRARSLLARGES